MLENVIEHKKSRISDAELVELFSLGNLYMSDFIDENSEQRAVPLTLMLAKESGLVQLKHTAPFDNMYRNYWYRSGMNRTMTEELRGIATKAMSLIRHNWEDVALDIGCNDGTLLKFYNKTLYTVGFDPAVNMEQYSRAYADKVIVDYFTAETYFKNVSKKAKIITAIAMFYDLEEPHRFVDDIESVLDKDGLWIVQMSYMPLMLKQHAIDNICFKPDEIILGCNKKICDVSIGDTVISGTGNLVAVKNTMRRSYNGELTKIKPIYLDPIISTPEHPIQVVRKEHFRFNCEQLRPNPREPKIEWVNANDVKRGDYVVVPKLPHNGTATSIDLIEFNNISSPAYRRGLLSFPLDTSTSWLLGLYVAEGFICGRDNNPYVSLSLNIKETDLADKAICIYNSLGYTANIQRQESKHSMEVRVVCASLARALKKWVGKGALNKKVPDFILTASTEIKAAFLQGLFAGDGYIKGNMVHFHTSSRLLAKQVQLLTLSLNGILGMSYTRPYKRTLRGKPVNSKDSWQLRGSSKVLATIFGYPRTRNEIGHVVIEDSYVLIPVKSVSSERYSGDVCNIETEDNTYLVSNAVVHNCHEHLEYYSLSSFKYLIKQHGLKVVDVELNDINGGSFRIYVRKQASNDDLFATAPYRDVAWFRVRSLLEYERKMNLRYPGTYTRWFEEVEEMKKQAVDFINGEKAKGKTIYGYGASTKGNTLLQYYGLDNTCITAIAERNPDKYGKRTVGTNIPIVSEDKMRRARPDYLLILPWHFIAEFKDREMDYLNAGGKFIVPLPQFKVIGSK